MVKLSSSLDTELHPHWGVLPNQIHREAKQRNSENSLTAAELQEKRYIQSK